jgi:hypothetical protein
VVTNYAPLSSIEAIIGALESVKAELEAGFIGSLRATLTGEILTDQIKLARTTLEETGHDAKIVAAVLSAAAFEDVRRVQRASTMGVLVVGRRATNAHGG